MLYYSSIKTNNIYGKYQQNIWSFIQKLGKKNAFLKKSSFSGHEPTMKKKVGGSCFSSKKAKVFLRRITHTLRWKKVPKIHQCHPSSLERYPIFVKI